MKLDELNVQVQRVLLARDGNSVLRALLEGLATKNAEYCFATGLAMPGRSLEPLVIIERWPRIRTETTCMLAFNPDDPLLSASLALPYAMVISPETEPANFAERSFFWTSLAASDEKCLVAIPFNKLAPYQGVCILGGFAMMPSRGDLDDMNVLVDSAFRRLAELGFISLERPGGLSPRERRIVGLTALGRTAGDIAEILDISHRTVHAHLQNAGVKLDARNKTQTVVEAMRFGQFSLFPPVGQDTDRQDT